MPGPTKLIGEMLNEEYTYRILSGIAHGQSWALQNLSFRLRPDYGRILKTENIPIGARLIERNLEPSHIIYFCRILAKVFAKTIHFSLILFGWNEERLMEIVKEQFSEIGIKDYDMKSLIT